MAEIERNFVPKGGICIDDLRIAFFWTLQIPEDSTNGVALGAQRHPSRVVQFAAVRVAVSAVDGGGWAAAGWVNWGRPI